MNDRDRNTLVFMSIATIINSIAIIFLATTLKKDVQSSPKPVKEIHQDE